MIKYIGSKRVLVPKIVEIVQEFGDVESVCDLFSGTSRVGHALKAAGYHVHANDLMAYAHVLAQTLVAANADEVDLEDLDSRLRRLNKLDGIDGYVTQRFAQEARFFQPHNARRIDAIRRAIEAEPKDLQAHLLTSLLLAADKVDSTVGVQMAYLKNWSDRSFREMELVRPNILSGTGEATNVDALELAASVGSDLAYLDPPYNQHSYLGNYHIWESLVRNDQPETYGKANKRVDCRTRPSPFNRRTEARSALEQLIGSIRSTYLVLSFSDEGHISLDEIKAIIGQWAGDYRAVEVPHRRHIGATIGIYNGRGERVGKVSHVVNREFLFIARRRRG